MTSKAILIINSREAYWSKETTETDGAPNNLFNSQKIVLIATLCKSLKFEMELKGKFNLEDFSQPNQDYLIRLTKDKCSIPKKTLNIIIVLAAQLNINFFSFSVLDNCFISSFLYQCIREALASPYMVMLWCCVRRAEC